eukprot:m.230009 g.230009  ORF g.230009 m.230009 type:complete len:489 (-) comp11990_c0_seq1:265-1731(-)
MSFVRATSDMPLCGCQGVSELKRRHSLPNAEEEAKRLESIAHRTDSAPFLLLPSLNTCQLHSSGDYPASDTDASSSSSYDSAYSTPRHQSITGRDVEQLFAGPFPRTPELEAYLQHAGTWDFDVQKLDLLSGGHPLTALVDVLFAERGLLESVGVDQNTFSRFMIALEDSYSYEPEVSFHNSIHAADVLNSAYAMLTDPSLADHITPLELFTALLAAAAHDVDHPGHSNLFLIHTADPRAIKHNYVSVLEKHHIETALSLLALPGCNILARFSEQDHELFTRLFTRIVLATDMSKHVHCRSDFGAAVEQLASYRNPEEGRRRRSSNVHPLSNPEYRATSLAFAVHCADISASAKNWENVRLWASRVFTEFFHEGDEERARGLQLGMLNDRTTLNVPNSQLGFIGGVVLPLWQLWARFTSEEACQSQLKNLADNLECWTVLLETATGKGDEYINLHAPRPTRYKRSSSDLKDGARRPAVPSKLRVAHDA